MIERQEIHCHECNSWVQFDMDMELNGNHVLTCPRCGHEHCRVVTNGVITGERWDQRNGPAQTYAITTSTMSITTNSLYSSTYDNSTTSGTSAIYTSNMWMNFGRN